MASLFPTAKSDPELFPYRSGLFFGFFNALVWQIAIGTPMVLFAERLGASSFQVGLAYSFVFLQTPLLVFATALIPRFGFKRVTMGGWAARSTLLVVPLVLALLAPDVGQPWMVNAFIWSVFFFSFFRTIGASALTPWFFGFLPPKIRGRYFGNDQMISGLAGVGTLLACALLFAFLPLYTALLIQYSISVVGSFLSFGALKRLPDIAKPRAISLRSVLRDTPRHMFTRSPFRHYIWLAAWYAVATTSIPPFSAYFLKVDVHLSAGRIMLFEVLRYVGVIAGAWLLRRRIDHTGAKPFFLLALVLNASVAVIWWLFLNGMAGSGTVLFGIYFIVGLAAVCWNVANLNYLPKIVPTTERALFVSIHSAVTAFLGGCSPIVWGLFLKQTNADGTPGMDAAMFQWFFVCLLVSVSILSMLVARLHEDKKTRFEPLIIGNAVLRPFRAASYLVNLFDLPGLARERDKPPSSPSK
ncbi:MAG: hypothetical protein K9M98_04715 [Cephaloticoccus sp.]|nr:hypothetical protein [Cephaloticoccus sp.]MCF7759787.1 hypothetical protein [Cephaloticoccus sp.]